MTEPTRVVVVGLGATGVAIATSLLKRNDCALVGAADIAPERAGVDIGELCGVGPVGTAVVETLDALPSADVAVVATTSWVTAIEPTLTALIERGMNVVSICEELRHPQLSHADLVERLDKLATDRGVSILGTGCNPGMVMDTLPLLLSSLTQRVDRVTIRRTAQMGRYGTILAKFGLGLTAEEFDAQQSAGNVMGHVGFEQSIAAIAAGLGWELDAIAVDPVRPAVIATTPRHGEHVVIQGGTVAGVVHQARGYRDSETVIELITLFGIFEDSDDLRPGDTLRLDGEQTIEVTAPSGYESFLSTISVACNTALASVEAAPGFRTMSDLPVSALASKGARFR